MSQSFEGIPKEKFIDALRIAVEFHACEPVNIKFMSEPPFFGDTIRLHFPQSNFALCHNLGFSDFQYRIDEREIDYCARTIVDMLNREKQKIYRGKASDKKPDFRTRDEIMASLIMQDEFMKNFSYDIYNIPKVKTINDQVVWEKRSYRDELQTEVNKWLKQ